MTTKQYAYRICIECGMRPQNSGFQYFVDAIEMVYNDRSYTERYMTKRLYPDIGKKYGITGSCVERCMRHAVENSRSIHNNTNFILSALCFIDYCQSGEESEENYQRAKAEVFDSFLTA